MEEYLDKTGLTYLWSKIKAKFDAKADKTALDAKADKSALDVKADKSALDAKADKSALDAKADKTTADALGKRIDNLILSSGTESSAEVVDARNGYDGTTYDTLGTAIRSQVSEIKSELSEEKTQRETADNAINAALDSHGTRLNALESYTIGVDSEGYIGVTYNGE